MVDKKLISETITELLNANVDKETIFSTLRDIGVDEGDIESNYAEITGGKPTVNIPVEKPRDPKYDIKISEDNSEKHEENLKATTKVIENINTDEENYVSPISEDNNPSSGDYKIILKQMSELESKIGEIKAQMTVLTKIMKDILEENRNILNKL